MGFKGSENDVGLGTNSLEILWMWQRRVKMAESWFVGTKEWEERADTLAQVTGWTAVWGC